MEKKLQPTTPKNAHLLLQDVQKATVIKRKTKKSEEPKTTVTGTTRETKLNGYQWLMFKKAHTHQHLSNQHSFVISFMISIYQHLQVRVPSINPKEW